MKQHAKQILTLCLVASLIGNAYLYSEVSGASKANLGLSGQVTTLIAENDNMKMEITSLEGLSTKQDSINAQLEKEILELKKQVEENVQKAEAAVAAETKAAEAKAAAAKASTSPPQSSSSAPVVPPQSSSSPPQSSSSTPVVTPPKAKADKPTPPTYGDETYTTTPPYPAPNDGYVYNWVLGIGWFPGGTYVPGPDLTGQLDPDNKSDAGVFK